MKRKLSKICTPYHNLLILIAACFTAAFTNDKEIISSPDRPAVVVDGDSLEIGAERIRLMGIDAPEYLQTCKDAQNKSHPCGKEATDYLKTLIGKNQVTCKIHHKDKYQRNLCTCYIGIKDINAEMVKSGNAVVYMESIYHQEQIEAKRNKRGIWNGRFIHPRLFRKLKEEQNKQNLNFHQILIDS